MELYQARDNFIIQDGYYTLWCNRLDGGIFPRQGVPPSEAFDPVCKGIVYGVIGKIQLFPGAEWKLLVITKRTLLGLLPGNHEAYRIDRIAVLPLAPGEVPDLELDLCEKHQSGGRTKKLLGGGDGQQKGLQQTWKSIKSAATNIKDNVKSTNTPRDIKDREKEKLEKRLLEETLKMFNDSDSFIYSPTGDITNNLQKQCGDHYDNNLPLWKRVDGRFFWNRYMLEDLLNNEDPLCSHWILPIIQGYCEIVHCVNNFEEEEPDELVEIQRGVLPPEEFDLLLISRRSIHRAGTRYKRRGVDEDGEVANYVETEQIIRTENHSVSFVQVRGSVPIYWSQPGFKYRPPPRLDKDLEETQMAFMSHFAHQLKYYGGVVIINLIDQTGREKIIGDAFMENILLFNNPLLTYITFDFHEYCRGMKFENVSILVESILDVLKDMRYCWTDSKGIICEQRSVFRINCMDCLDRTNVVQAALARHVMEVQLRKLGKLLPDQSLPVNIRSSFQEMWANNGDAISRQYAGTAAMKGDFTRTGERRFTGVMKDGYNSANRYYLNRFKAVYRQTVIDAMLGNPLTEDLTAAMAALKNGDEEDPWTMEREECVAQLVIHCQWLLLSETEEYLGGWALVDPFYSPEGEINQDQDVILLLTYDAYYVASYDDDAERITQYERINLEDVEKIEIGFEPSFKTRYLFIRIHYNYQNSGGYFHTLRTIQHRTPEEARGVLLGIADAFTTARSANTLTMKILESKLDKKKSKPPPDVIQISSKSRLSGWSKPKTIAKSQQDLESSDQETNNSGKQLKSLLKHRLGGIPRPYSDPCLTKQDVDNNYQVQRKRSGASSAPLSSASSSSGDSDSDKDEETSDQSREDVLAMQRDRLEREFERKLKPARKLECRSEETLVTQKLLVTKDTEGQEKGQVTDESLVAKNTKDEEEGLATREPVVAKDTEGEKEDLGTRETTKDKDTEEEEEKLVITKSTVTIDTEGNQDKTEKVGVVHIPSTEARNDFESISEPEDSDKPDTDKQNTIGNELTKEKESWLESFKSSSVTEANDLPSNNECKAKDEDENRLQEREGKPNKSTEINGQISEEFNTENNQSDKSEKDVDITTDQTNINLENICEIKESYNESKRKLRNENILGFSNREDEDTMNSDAQPESIVSPNPTVNLGLGGSFRSMAVSFKSKASADDPDISSAESNGEKSTRDVEQSQQGFNRFRFSGRSLGSRGPSNTTGSNKTNIFASAQARGRTLLPDLRNKLSSISFPRARSPRLTHKQHTVDSDSVHQHKRHKHKHKCLTRIIEL